MPLYLAGVYHWDKLHVSARSKFEEFGPRVREEVREGGADQCYYCLLYLQVVAGVRLLHLFDTADIRTLFQVDTLHCTRGSSDTWPPG